MLRSVGVVAAAALSITACSNMPSDPAQAACLSRMEAIAQNLLPAFAAEGYQPTVHLMLDAALANGRGFASPPGVLGDSAPGGRVRLRPALCANPPWAVVVVAHEMSHIALKHMGGVATGVSLEWEIPPKEKEADALALAVLKRAGGPRESIAILECRLGGCVAPRPGKPRQLRA